MDVWGIDSIPHPLIEERGIIIPSILLLLLTVGRDAVLIWGMERGMQLYQDQRLQDCGCVKKCF